MAARRRLEALYDQYLLTEPAHGRYRLHDLLRAHAHALAGRLDPDRDRRPRRPPGPYYPAPAVGTMPAAVPALADHEQALA